MGQVLREKRRYDFDDAYRPHLPKRWQRIAFIALYLIEGLAIMAVIFGLACLFGMGDIV